MEELHIQPSELYNLPEKKKWWYYYLVMYKRIKEKKETDEQMDDINNNRDSMKFPDDFVSFARNRAMIKEMEEKDVVGK